MSILRRFTNLFRRKKADLALALTSNGEKFYTFKDISDMPLKRQKALLVALKSYQWGISNNNIKKYTNLIEEAVNEGSMSKVGMCNEILKAYIDLDAVEDPLFDIANICVIIGGESLDDMDEKSTEIKKNLFNDSLDVRFFFIMSSIMQAGGLLSSSNEETITNKVNQVMLYLSQKEVKENQEIFLTRIRKEAS